MRRLDETKVYGRHACRALYARRPGDVIRAYLSSDAAPAFGDMMRELAAAKKSYKVVGEDELEKLTETRHHEGICLLVKALPTVGLKDVLSPPGPGWLVALAGVENPHNVGAIVRTAAHFGARALIAPESRGRLPGSALRTAQGGGEWVPVIDERIERAIEEAQRAKFAVIATSSHEGKPLYATDLPARSVVLLGAEGDGLAPALLRKADLVVEVPGSGHVESLNVSAAAAVVLSELWRRHR